MIASMPSAFVLRVLSALSIAFSLGSPSLVACSCRDVELFCNVLPSSPPDRNRAVFTGRVIEVFPREKETLRSVLAHVQELVPSDQPALSLDQQKRLRLELAKGLLTAAERQLITEAKNEAELWNIEFRWWGARRVRLEVLEPFWGVKVGSVEVSTAMNPEACGISFAVGESYLVDAHRNAPTGQWHASFCSRTREVVAAQDEIEALRAWQRERPLQRRVYGWLPGKGSSRPQPLAANQRLFLRAGASQYETRSDERGYFRFADVAPGQYRLDADALGYEVKWIQLSRSINENGPIDLDTNRCAELFVSFEQH